MEFSVLKKKNSVYIYVFVFNKDNILYKIV